MATHNILNKIKVLDAYPKVNEDFFTKTMSGGIITIVSSVVMILLFLSELRLYLITNTHHELTVDTSRGEQISINVDVTFPKIPCSWLSLDAMDISGELHLDVDHDIYKQRIGANGVPVTEAVKHDVHSTKKVVVDEVKNVTCGPCYGAEMMEGQCCNTCDEVRAAYRKKGWALTNVDHIEVCKHDSYLQSIKEELGEGCRMWGRLDVNKVAGNFHFAPGRSYQQGNMHVHDLAPFDGLNMDFTHTVNVLSFGQSYPGKKDPLNGVTVVQKPATPKKTEAGGPTAAPQITTGMFQYFLKVVPTIFTDVSNSTISTNQFSVTENYRESQAASGRSLPGVFFFYDLSPIKVKIVEKKSSALHFLTNVCAIVGGVFTVSGIIDAFVYHGENLIRKKMELGKLM